MYAVLFLHFLMNFPFQNEFSFLSLNKLRFFLEVFLNEPPGLTFLTHTLPPLVYDIYPF